MAIKSNYEVKTQQKFTTIATKAALDDVTPEVGHPCLIGGALVGVVVSLRVKGGVADDKAVVDVGRSIYLAQVDSPVDASGELDEGGPVYYDVGATAEPYLTTVPGSNVLAGSAVLANDGDTFPKGTTGGATVESVAVLFNA